MGRPDGGTGAGRAEGGGGGGTEGGGTGGGGNEGGGAVPASAGAAEPLAGTGGGGNVAGTDEAGAEEADGDGAGGDTVDGGVSEVSGDRNGVGGGVGSTAPPSRRARRAAPLRGRSAGSLAMARATASASTGGTPVSGGAGVSMICRNRPNTPVPSVGSNGERPVHRACRVAASE